MDNRINHHLINSRNYEGKKMRKITVSHFIPKTINNVYKGSPIAKWVFMVMVVMTVGRSLAHILLPDGGAQSIATIPLDAFTASGASVIIGMFAQWGLTQLMFGLLYVIVLWRYQSLIPLMWSFLFFEWTGRLFIGLYKPFETLETAPGAIGNMIFPGVALLMLVLSLQPAKTSAITSKSQEDVA
jgi:hypothetical protein